MTNMRVQVIHRIRDARGLTCHEKMMLLIVESRGDYHCSARTAAAEMGMSKATLYRTRAALVSKGLLEVIERPRATTHYRVLTQGVLAAYLPPSHSETPSRTETTPSHTETTPSRSETGGVSESGTEGDLEGDREGDREGSRGRRHLALASGSSDPTPEYLAELRDRVRTRPPTARGAL